MWYKNRRLAGQQEKAPVQTKKNFKAYLSGELPLNFLAKHRKFLFFTAILIFLLIVNTQIASRVVRENVKLSRELDKCKAKYLTKSTFLIQLKKRSVLVEMLNKRNIELYEASKPPKRVELIKE